MFRNYLKIAWRNLLRAKSYAIINVVGLAVGMASCLLILLYVQNELSFDRFHENGGRIFRVTSEETNEGAARHLATTYAPLASMLQIENPEIEHVARFFPQSVVVTYGEKKFQESAFYLCDANVLEVFSFKLANGDPKTALTAPNAVLLTQSTAQKYFGKENAVGKTLRIENTIDLVVAGILEDVPVNSHIQFDFLANIQVVDHTMGPWVLQHGWHWPPMYTYLLLPPDLPAATVAQRFPDLMQRHLSESRRAGLTLHLQPLGDIYLRSGLENEIGPTSNILYVYLFSLVAAFILLIACINFMNLATARSTTRAREVGLRKVVGAGRRQLVRQFLGEALVYACLAMILAVVLVQVFLPTFNQLLGKTLAVLYTENWLVLAGLAGITLLVGLLAGSYPAFFLARFRPIQALQGKSHQTPAGRGSLKLRSLLVVAQFVISLVLITVTFGVHKQLGYLQNARLGIDKEHLIIIPIREEAVQENFETLKNRVLQQPGVLSATTLSNFPWERGYYGYPFSAEGVTTEANASMATLMVDPDFLQTFGIKIIEGRGFSQELRSDRGEAFLLNQAAVRKLGWESAVNRRFVVDKIVSGEALAGRVVGVMQDFHLRSLHHEVEPLVVLVSPLHYYLDNLAVRLSGQDITGSLAALEQTWSEHIPGRPFEYFFLDNAIERLYQNEQRLGSVFNYFAGLTILVACLGLFGLASFAAEQRLKEVGIRKVLGASVVNVVALMAKDYVKLVLIANVIAWPVAWFFVGRWLEDFAYRVEIGWQVFALAGGLALVIALLTVSTQALRAALANPVKALRCE